MTEPECIHCEPDSVIHIVGTTSGAAHGRKVVYQCSECNLFTTEDGQSIDHEDIVFDPGKMNRRRARLAEAAG